MEPYFAEHAPYPKLPAFEWPIPGVLTWVAPERSFFGSCSGRPECTGPCPVGLVVTVDGGSYGCDCPCHRHGSELHPRIHGTTAT